MKMARKIRRQRAQKEKKMFNQALKRVSQRFEMLGDKCRACGVDFDTTNPEHVEEWKVYIQDDDPRLVCPDCNKKIIELREEMMEEDDEV